MLKITKTEPTSIVKDFDVFVSYLENNNVIATKTQRFISRKHLLELNNLMTRPETDVKSHYNQDHYPLLHLFYCISMAGKLFYLSSGKGNKLYFTPSERIKEYKILNDTEKYFALLQILWIDTNWEDLQILNNFRISSLIEQMDIILKEFVEILPNNRTLFYNDSTKYIFLSLSSLILYLSYFGIWTIERLRDDDIPELNRYFIPKSISLTDFGVQIVKVLAKLSLKDWNKVSPKDYFHNSFIDFLASFSTGSSLIDIKENMKENTKTKKINKQFIEYFTHLFEPGKLQRSLGEVEQKHNPGNYIFKVSLNKGVWRKIKLSSNHTLEDLHLMIQKAFDFDNDHMYAFYMDMKPFSDNAYNCPESDKGPYTDEAVIGDIEIFTKQEFMYLFDFGDQWIFSVKLEEILENEKEITEPIIIDRKGESPEQYPY